MSFSEVQKQHMEIILEHSRIVGNELVACIDGQSHQVNPVCGDEITLQLQLRHRQIIDQVRWRGHGCAVSQASASLLADLARGLTIFELSGRIKIFIDALSSRGKIQLREELFEDAVALGSLSPNATRAKCAMLAWVAADHALIEISNSPLESNVLS